MGIEIARLTKNDYDELIAVLDRTFSTKYQRPMSFEASLPKMGRRTDENMNHHFGLREDGVLKSVLGVYPLPTRIAGQDLLFSTVGNVATLPEAVGKGYMTQLLKVAMQELKDIGAVASRLGGKRTRYHRYGYDPAGVVTRYELDLAQWPAEVVPKKVRFTLVERQNEALLERLQALHQAGPFIVYRPTLDDFYDSLVAWLNVPYVATTEEGELLGYLCASADGGKIAELESVSTQAFQAILYGWLTQKSPLVEIPLMPHLADENNFLLDICAKHTIAAPCQFKIIQWEKVVDAALKLKATYVPLPRAEKRIEVEGYGTLLVRTGEGRAECIRLETPTKAAEICLPWTHASLFFFGPTTLLADRLGCGGLFPLPLSWNLQDRV